MIRTISLWIAAVSTLMALGCARDLVREPVEMKEIEANDSQVIIVKEATSVNLDSSYMRTIAAGSEWRSVGKVGNATVFKPVGQIFSIEGAHVHEAYLIVDEDKLLAFYLPGERKINRLAKPVVIKTK